MNNLNKMSNSKKNVVVSILHATKLIKSRRAEIKELKVSGKMTSDNLEIIENIFVGQNITLGGDITIGGKVNTPKGEPFVVESVLNVKTDANIEGNLSVKGSSMFGSISATELKDPNGTLYGKTSDIKKITPGGKSSGGKIDKPSRADHEHAFPESIKNPNPLNFLSTPGGSVIGSYDGSQELNLQLNPTNIGAAPKEHASTTQTYGVGSSTRYGHVQLADTFESSSTDSTNGIMTLGDTRGSSAGVAATPKMVASLASKISDVYISKSEAKDTFIKTEQTEIVIKGTFKLRNSVFLGGSDSNPSDNMMVVYGVGDTNIAKIKLGQGPQTAILTSPNDNNLYIRHNGGANLYRKIRSFEIERVITCSSQDGLTSKKAYRKWRPSRTGWYRIYLIGGGGVATNGHIRNKDAVGTSAGGFGNATLVSSGYGGGGGCVSITDLLVDDVRSNSYIYSSDSDSSDGSEDGDDAAAYAYFSFPTALMLNTSTKYDGSMSVGGSRVKRCVAVEGLEAFGTIIGKKDNTTMGHTSNVDTATTDSAKIVKYYDAFAGHGCDAQSQSDGQDYGTEEEHKYAWGGCQYYGIAEAAYGKCYGGTYQYTGTDGNRVKSDVTTYMGLPITTCPESEYDKTVAKTRREDGWCGGSPGSIGVHGMSGIQYGHLVGTPSGGITTPAKYRTLDTSVSPAKVKYENCVVSAMSGPGGMLSIRELDNYRGDYYDGDPSLSFPDKILSVPKTAGGDGYFGGGNGGGYIICKNTASSGDGNRNYVKGGANRNRVTTGPCAIIVYMGNKLEL